MRYEEILRQDGSWKLDKAGRAVFRLAPETAGARAGVVEQLGGDPSDPEQWESVLIEAVLTDPASAGLRRLKLDLTDFHHSARRAAEALAVHRRERLTKLTFGHDFTILYEYPATSTGGRFDPLDYLHKGFVNDSGFGLWAALPALKKMAASGTLLFDDIASETLTTLRLRGALFSDGSVFPSRTPAVTTLFLNIQPDIHGVACSVLQLEELTPGLFPHLKHLDLSESMFDESDGEVAEVLESTGLRSQLETLILQ